MTASTIQPVWIPATGRPRCVWPLFRRDFTLGAEPSAAELALFAASRYRLVVNGAIVGYGPARYVPPWECFDRHDLTRWLRPGENVVVVECCFIDFNHYQSMPDDHGRFVAWGGVEADGRRIDLGTPGEWRGRLSQARRDDAPPFTFAIGPAEVCDTAAREAELGDPSGWLTPSVLDASPPSEARDLAMPSLEPLPMKLIQSGRLANDERRIGLVSAPPASRGGGQSPAKGQRFRYATFLHAPEACRINLGHHWGPHFLNGRAIEGEANPRHGNRLDAEVDLHAGWNLLCGEPEQLHPVYPLLLGLPRRSGVTAHATPDRGDPRPLRYQPPRERPADASWSANPPARLEDIDDHDPWRLVDERGEPHCPARLMSWDRLDDAVTRHDLVPVTIGADGSWTGVFDRGTEYLGHLRVEVEAPRGTILDVAYDERRRADGCLDLFATNPFTETADRFVTAGGKQTLETFHPRGGRYAQVTIRPPQAAAGPVKLLGVSVRDARCLPPVDAAFESGDELLQWTFDVGVESMNASIEDTFCDSPWRERGCYLGDSYVQSMAHLSLSTDHRVVRRALRLFAQGQRADGQLPCVVPAWLRKPHGDFTLIYALWLRDYWRRTGDRVLVRECLPAVDRLLASPTWIASTDSPLWDATEGNRLFIDWGVRREARTYDENGVLNALRIPAARAAAELHDALGGHDRADGLRRGVEPIADAFRDRLWLEAEGRFAGGTRGRDPVLEPVLHVNILALAFGLADARQEPRLADYVLDRLGRNAGHACRGVPHDDFAELYYLKFALDALTRLDLHAAAVELIRSHMQPMREAGAWTYWECLHRGIHGRGSLCHAWAAGPLDYLLRNPCLGR